MPLTERRGPDNDVRRRVGVHAILALLLPEVKAHAAASLTISPVEALAAVCASTNRAHLGSVYHLARHRLMRLAQGGSFGSSSLSRLALAPPTLHSLLLHGRGRCRLGRCRCSGRVGH